MAQETQENQVSFKKKSSYAAFMNAVEKLQHMAETFQTLLLDAHYSDVEDRTEIVRYSYLLKGDILWDFFDNNEKSNLNKFCSDLESINASIANYESFPNRQLLAKTINSHIGVFEHKANEFIQYFNQLMVIHNTSAIPMKQKQEIERFRNAVNIKPNRFFNKDHIPISIEMELFCRALYLRATQNWYNIVGVEGEAGVGKSNFVWAASSTLAGMYQDYNKSYPRFDPEKQIMLNESRDYVEKHIAQMPKLGILDLDEAGNQLNSKTVYEQSQLAITNRLNLIRFMNLTIFTTWPYIKGLDSTLRNKQMQLLVTIQERGSAIVRIINKNPYASEGIGSPLKYKDTQVDTHDEAADMLEADIQTVLIVPFYEIPAKLWKPYEDRKLIAKNMSKALTTKSESSAFYTDFLIQLDAMTPQITTDMLDDYSAKVAYKLYMQPLVKRLAKATGQKKQDIWRSESVADPDNIGILTVNRLITSYIQKLQAEKKGSEEAEKVEVDAK